MVAENVVFEYPRGWRRWFVLFFEKYVLAVMNKMPGVTFVRLPENKETYWSRFANDFQQRNNYVVGEADMQSVAVTVAEIKDLGNTLELACGDGFYTQILAKKATQLTATDWSEEMIAVSAKQFAEQQHITVEQANAKQLPYPDTQFDTVFAANLLHIIDNPEAVIHEAYRVLKANGRFCVLDFCISGMQVEDIEAMGKRYMETYGERPPHGKNLGVEELTDLLAPHFTISHAEYLGKTMKAAWLIAVKR